MWRCFERHRLEQLVVLGADELAICRGCYKWHLVEEQPQGWIGSLGRLRITAAGRSLYEREWVRYRELYPEIEAPEPRASLTVDARP